MHQMTGKQLKFVSGLPVERSRSRIDVIKDEAKLPERRRRSSTSSLGGWRTARNSMRSSGDPDRGFHCRHGKSSKHRPNYDGFPIDVSTTARKRPIIRDEQEELYRKKPRKDPEISSQSTVGQSKQEDSLRCILTSASMRGSVTRARRKPKGRAFSLLITEMSARIN